MSDFRDRYGPRGMLTLREFWRYTGHLRIPRRSRIQLLAAFLLMERT